MKIMSAELRNKRKGIYKNAKKTVRRTIALILVLITGLPQDISHVF
jgi:hypothetical protein